MGPKGPLDKTRGEVYIYRDENSASRDFANGGFYEAIILFFRYYHGGHSINGGWDGFP